MAEKKKAGRPPKYTSPEQMQEKIDAYFAECRGIPFTDDNGLPMTNKWGAGIYKVSPKPLTITGLALACGFNSRTSFLDYVNRNKSGENEEGEKIFASTITRAKAIVEEYAESRLFDKDGANGAKFSLANNFKAWGEKPDGTEIKNDVTIKVELTDE